MRNRRASTCGYAVIALACLALAPACARPSTGRSVSLLITGGTVVTMDAAARVITDGAIAIDGDSIVEVGLTGDLTARFTSANVIDARGQIVLPGLINTHTHAPMVLYRGLADDLALMDWLTKYIFPAEKATVSPEFVRVGTRLAALEMIESGTTSFVDMYYFEDDIATVTRDAGLRAVLGQSVIQFPVADAPTPKDALVRAEAFLKKWKGDALITAAVAPHAPYTLDDATLKAVRAIANQYEAPLLIHLAETKDEIGIIQKSQKTTPAKYLDSLGVWNGRSIAAHAVWLDATDMAMLRERGVGLAHNPESNMKLASGIAAVPEWLRLGIKAGLGTDGAASNNDLDMFEAMRAAALLHKVASGNPEALPARQALQMATRLGAEAIGQGARIGSLEAGKQADIITVAVDEARQTPMFDPVSHLVYVSRGDDVRNTVVAGRVLMQNRRVQTLDARQVIADANKMAATVRAAVAPTGASSGK